MNLEKIVRAIVEREREGGHKGQNKWMEEEIKSEVEVAKKGEIK